MSKSNLDKLYEQLYHKFNSYSVDYLHGHFDAVCDCLQLNHLTKEDRATLLLVQDVLFDILEERGFVFFYTNV